jgi:hypothetical protein
MKEQTRVPDLGFLPSEGLPSWAPPLSTPGPAREGDTPGPAREGERR